MTKKEIAIKLIKGFSTGDTAFTKKVLLPTYIQHNLEFPTGPEPLIGAFEHFAKAKVKPTVEVVRAIEDKDYVVLHVKYNFGEGDEVALDVFRFEGDKIAEHWDNLLPISKPNPSGHTQLDGTVEIKDLALTTKNKETVLAFQTALSKGDFGTAAPYLHPNYIQHNPSSGDGLAGVQAAIAEAAKRGIQIQFGKIHHVIGEGDFVFISSEGKVANKEVAIFDIFRVANNKLVEHWDVIAPVIDKNHPNWANNPNGKW